MPSEVVGEERRGRSLVASGDTAYLPELATFARGADVLVHEATYGEEHAHLAAERDHSTAAQAATVAADAGVEGLYLVHLSPRYHDPQGIERLLAEARAIFPNTEIPADLTVVEIPLPG
jgi:ribonuclease Z